MEPLIISLLVLTLGNVIWLERRVSAIDTIVKRLDKNSKGKNNEKE